jgi:hypothetical protein
MPPLKLCEITFIFIQPSSALPLLGHIVSIKIQSRPVFYENRPSDNGKLVAEERILISSIARNLPRPGQKIRTKISL